MSFRAQREILTTCSKLPLPEGEGIQQSHLVILIPSPVLLPSRGTEAPVEEGTNNSAPQCIRVVSSAARNLLTDTEAAALRFLAALEMTRAYFFPCGNLIYYLLPLSACSTGRRISDDGKSQLKVLPAPNTLLISRTASCRSSTCLTMANPSPVPPLCRERAVSTR